MLIILNHKQKRFLHSNNTNCKWKHCDSLLPRGVVMQLCCNNFQMTMIIIVSLLLLMNIQYELMWNVVNGYIPNLSYIKTTTTTRRRRYQYDNIIQHHHQLQQQQVYNPFLHHTFFMTTTDNSSNNSKSSSSSTTTTTNEPDFTSNDPYRILGIQRNLFQQNNIDDKELKRIYKRLAMKYHPDIITTKDSSNEEKKIASDRFAKINTAYNTLLLNNNSSSSASSSSTQTKSSSTSSSGWEPPHRRTRSYTTTTRDNASTTNKDTTNNPFSTDWRDYIPKSPNDNNTDEMYDTGGDSFGKIFADLLQQGASTVIGATSGSSNNGGIFKDFIEFLEQNVDGYRNNNNDNNDDTNLLILLQTGTKHEIADEMDETQLVIQQLTNKLQKIQKEIIQIQTDLSTTTTTTTSTNRRYSETLELQERLDEIQAQKNIVENYIKRARNRLAKIQTRYKELLLYGDNNNNDGSGTTTSSNSNNKNNDYNPSPQTTYNKSPSQQSSSPYSSSTTSTTINDRSTSSVGNNNNASSGGVTDSDQGWKDQGFGSFSSRGRGSSRRRPSSSSSSSPSSSSSTQPRSSPQSPTANDNSTYSTTTSSKSSSSSTTTNTSSNQSQTPSSMTNNNVDESTDTYVPPHRRTSTTTTSNNSKSFTQRMEQDKQRLREIKVEEAFDQLKRDLGL